jgi:MoxR-like ATPase
MSKINDESWYVYEGNGDRKIKDLPHQPPWRDRNSSRGEKFKPDDSAIKLVNTAFYLRRPLLIEGKPGVGKTSLAYHVANQLGLGKVLRWSITTKTKLEDGLYSYDAIARLQDASLSRSKDYSSSDTTNIGKYLCLGPLGTAFVCPKITNDGEKLPRVLLIDEIDKSDIDLPNDLLHVFEEGEFVIPELARLSIDKEKIPTMDDSEPVEIIKGKLTCKLFPLVIMTSNGERQFPAAFLRRCLRLQIEQPNQSKLEEIVKSYFEQLSDKDNKLIEELLNDFVDKREENNLATDQLLNAIYLAITGKLTDDDLKPLKKHLFEPLSN